MTRTSFVPSLSWPAFALAAAVTLSAAPAEARKSPLSGQPAVRHKMELRQKRFELTPTFDMSVAADYKNTLSGGLKAEYHLTDMLSVGGMILFGTSLDSSLTQQIDDSLPDSETPGEPTPSKSQFKDHLNTTPFHGSLNATLTPWFGKMALFGRAFVNFDIYLTGGFGFAQTKNSWDAGDKCTVADRTVMQGGSEVQIFDNPKNDCPHNAGFNPGVVLGVGMHVFANKWMAVDLSFHDYLFNDNPSGLDFNADQKVDEDDRRFLSHLFFGVGLSLYLPPKVQISE